MKKTNYAQEKELIIIKGEEKSGRKKREKKGRAAQMQKTTKERNWLRRENKTEAVILRGDYIEKKDKNKQLTDSKTCMQIKTEKPRNN